MRSAFAGVVCLVTVLGCAATASTSPAPVVACGWDCRGIADVAPLDDVAGAACRPRDFADRLLLAHRLETTYYDQESGAPREEQVEWLRRKLGIDVRVAANAELDPNESIGLCAPTETPAMVVDHVSWSGSSSRWVLDAGGIVVVPSVDYDAQFAAAQTQWPRFEETRSRLRVRWAEPAIHESRFDEGVQDDWPLLARDVLLSGRLLWIGDDGNEEPFTWPVPIRVVIARESGANLDPARDFDSNTSGCRATVTNGAGEFRVHVDVDEIERIPGRRASFAVGVAMPALEPAGLWSDRHRVVAGTIGRVDVEGPPELGPELTLLAGLSGLDPNRYDPTAFVRACNRLQSVGAPRATEVLADFARRAPYDGFRGGPVGSPTLDHANSASLFLVARLLFEPPSGEPYSRVSAGFVYPDAPLSDALPDPRYPLFVVDDLPFFAPWWLNGRSGSDSDVVEFVCAAARNWPLRKTPLVPTDDPLAAADRAREALDVRPGEYTRAGNLAIDNDIRGQVWRALAHLVGQPPKRELPWIGFQAYCVDRPVTDVEWETLKAKVRALGGVHWDAEGQRYVAGARRR